MRADNDLIDYQTGERYYTRFEMECYEPLEAGKVWEITDTNYRDILSNESNRMSANRRRFALYLCGGDRLVVMDRYNRRPYRKPNDLREDLTFNSKSKKYSHNRTVVQLWG